MEKKQLTLRIILPLLTILLYSILGLNKSAYAQTETKQLLRVSPAIFTVELSPSTVYSYQLTVENLQNFAVPIRITQEDFVIQDDTGNYSFETNAQNSLISWINFEKPEHILQANEKKIIPFTVSTPKIIDFGGYHGMIFIEPLFPSIQSNSSLLSTKIGTPVIASIGGAETRINPLRILSLSYPQFITSLQNFSVEIQIQNNSLFHASAYPFIRLTPIWGDEKKVFLDEKLIFPGKTRAWRSTLELDSIQPNIYRTSFVLPVGNGNQIVQNSILLFLPFTFIITLFSIVFVSITFLLIKSKRIDIKAFAREILRGN